MDSDDFSYDDLHALEERIQRMKLLKMWLEEIAERERARGSDPPSKGPTTN